MCMKSKVTLFMHMHLAHSQTQMVQTKLTKTQYNHLEAVQETLATEETGNGV